MKVIIEIEITKCSECPYSNYEGTSWSEDVYICTKTKGELFSIDEIPNNCPFIKSTLEKLQNKK